MFQKGATLLEIKKAIRDVDNILYDWRDSPSSDYCVVRGVTCDNVTFNVVALNLSGLNLDGEISTAIGDLTSLLSLDLSCNMLSGPIPSILGNLTVTEKLRVKERFFQEGDLVMRKIEASGVWEREKLAPNWEGPYKLSIPINQIARSTLHWREVSTHFLWVKLTKVARGWDETVRTHLDQSIVNFVTKNFMVDGEIDLLPGLCKQLEMWLMEVVFPSFRYLERLERVGGSPLSVAASITRVRSWSYIVVLDGVKVSAIQELHKVFPLGPGEAFVRRQGNGEVSSSEFTLESEEYGGQCDPRYNQQFRERDRPDNLLEQEMMTYLNDANVKNRRSWLLA
ncbi:hypothetical protein AgCh_033431 [Apium graveolens]